MREGHDYKTHKAQVKVRRRQDYYTKRKVIYKAKGVEKYQVDYMQDNGELKEHSVKKIHRKKVGW